MTNPFAEGGLFRDPEQMRALAGNPMFNMGMGLLSSAHDPRINPFQAAMGGLVQSGEQQRILEEEQRNQSLREALAAYFAQQGQPPRVDQVMQTGVGQTAAGPGQSEPMRDFYRYGWEQALNR